MQHTGMHSHKMHFYLSPFERSLKSSHFLINKQIADTTPPSVYSLRYRDSFGVCGNLFCWFAIILTSYHNCVKQQDQRCGLGNHFQTYALGRKFLAFPTLLYTALNSEICHPYPTFFTVLSCYLKVLRCLNKNLGNVENPEDLLQKRTVDTQ